MTNSGNIYTRFEDFFNACLLHHTIQVFRSRKEHTYSNDFKVLGYIGDSMENAILICGLDEEIWGDTTILLPLMEILTNGELYIREKEEHF